MNCCTSQNNYTAQPNVQYISVVGTPTMCFIHVNLIKCNPYRNAAMECETNKQINKRDIVSTPGRDESIEKNKKHTFLSFD